MPTHDLPVTPISLPSDTEGVLFFGGTFDPPHQAHATIPADVRDRWLGRRWMLAYVPAGRSPHKAERPTEAKHRLSMLRLGLASVPRHFVWTDEIDREAGGRPSYTVDSLTRARKATPRSVGFRLLVGSDQAAALHRWREPRTIVEVAPPIVMLRPPHTSAGEVLKALESAAFWTPVELEAWARRIDSGAVIDVSSTEIRRQIGAGEAVEGLLHPDVLGYIRANGLYGAMPGATERDRQKT